MSEPPYRAMPLPPRPPRAWRPIVDRGLAIFNGLALVGGLWYGAAFPVRGRLVLASFSLLAVIGFLRRRRRPWWLRLGVTLPSGVLWVLLGSFHILLDTQTFLSLYRPGCPTPSLHAEMALGPLFLIAGILTIESAFAWLRRTSDAERS